MLFLVLYLIVVFVGWIYVVFILNQSGWWTLVFLVFASVKIKTKSKDDNIKSK